MAQDWTIGRASSFYGVVEAIVVDNKDPDGYGRIQVQYPWLGDETISAWARMTFPMAGKSMGWVIYPEIDDEVLVDFINGNVNEPVIVGCLYNGKDTPPYDNADGDNNIRTLVSRSGHVIEIDDTDGSEKITIKDTSGGLEIVMDTAEKLISVKSSGDITFTADANFVVEAKEVTMSASGDIKHDAGGNWEAKASTKAVVEGGSEVNVKGATVNLN